MLKPIRDNVIVRLIVEEKSEGGLVIPQSAQRPETLADVVAVPSGRRAPT